MTQLSNERAQQMLGRAEQCARNLNIAVCIALVDQGAHLKAFQRMDDAFTGSVDVAIRKARTSALFPLDSGSFGELVRSEQLTAMEQSNGGLALFPGGLPIVIDNVQIGAIGISGGSAAQDVEIARYALEQES